MSTVRGKVQKIETKGITLDKWGAMNAHTITVSTPEGTSVAVQKLTKPETSFNIPTGTEVQVTFTESQYQSKDGQMLTNRKIVKDGLVILQNGAPNTGTSTPGATWNNSTQKNADYNKGQRTGMLLKAGLDLATARKKLTVADILQATRDMEQVANAFENNTPQQTKATTTDRNEEESPF